MALFNFKKKTDEVKKPASSAPTPSPAPAAPRETPPGQHRSPAPRKIEWRVLFVGGNPLWFRQIEPDIACLQPTWSCSYAGNGAVAEAALASTTYDALVLNGPFPETTALLPRLEAKIGNAICLVCCDHSDRPIFEHWKRSETIAIPRESDAAALVADLKRAARVRDWMAEPSIKKLLPRIHKLPTAPKLHAQVTEQLRLPDASIHTVALLISQDPVMAAKVLQVANSARFGLTQQLTDTAEAVMILGTEQVRALILLAGIFSQYAAIKCPGFSPDPIWNHSMKTALFAGTIAFTETKDVQVAGPAFTAGLLHDIGKLILAANLPEIYSKVWQSLTDGNSSQLEAEQTALGTTHAEIGACLLATWGLPLPILEAIAWHHQPNRSTDSGFSLLAAVHVANVLAQENGKETVRDQIDTQFLSRAGLGDCVDRWRGFCGLPARPGEADPAGSA